MSNSTYKQITLKVSRVGIIGNIFLSVAKLSAGIIANSAAMISDAVNSISDVVSTAIAMIGIHISGKDSDQEHQYGHERLECVASIILAIILFATGLGIGYSAVDKIINISITTAIPGKIALYAAVISVVTKEGLYRYTIKAANKTNSVALKAAAYDHRSDVLSSCGIFIGILGSRLGLPILDPIASIIICLFILKSSIDIFRDSMDKMVDKSCDEATEEEIRKTALQQAGVISVDMLQTRLFGARIYVDIEIAADGKSSLCDAHNIAEAVHDAIENNFENVKHCMVHVNPVEK